MLSSEALLLFLIHLLFGWRKHLVLPALDFSKSGPSAITHTIKDQRFLISFVDFKDFSTSYSLKIRLDFRIISNSSIVTVTALILVLLSWDILPMDFALPVICTISCHFGHFVEVVYMSAWYDKWMFSLFFFCLMLMLACKQFRVCKVYELDRVLYIIKCLLPPPTEVMWQLAFVFLLA